jgi:hypothetical protein
MGLEFQLLSTTALMGLFGTALPVFLIQPVEVIVPAYSNERSIRLNRSCRGKT